MSKRSERKPQFITTGRTRSLISAFAMSMSDGMPIERATQWCMYMTRVMPCVLRLMPGDVERALKLFEAEQDGRLVHFLVEMPSLEQAKQRAVEVAIRTALHEGMSRGETAEVLAITPEELDQLVKFYGIGAE